MTSNSRSVTDRGDRCVTSNTPADQQNVTDHGGKTAGLTDGDRFSEAQPQSPSVTGDRFSQFNRPIRARTRAGAVEEEYLSHPSPRTLTDRVRQHIETTTGTRLGGRTLKLTTCRQCHAAVLTGLDADICARDVTVDPDPVTAAGELLALAAERATYDVVPNRGRLELEQRLAAHIASRRYPVVAQHRCGQPLPSQPTVAPSTSHQEEPCPF